MKFRLLFLVLTLLIFVTYSTAYYLHSQSAQAAHGQLEAIFEATPKPLDARTKTTDCHVNGPFPDHECTPGAVFPDATTDEICVSGYTKTVRNVSVDLKRQVYTEYGLAYPQKSGAYEADHMIPLELGGNNDIANLFPEAAEPKPGFHEKDLVENFLHKEACAGRVPLSTAQSQIANDWLSVYNNLSAYQIWELKQEFN